MGHIHTAIALTALLSKLEADRCIDGGLLCNGQTTLTSTANLDAARRLRGCAALMYSTCSMYKIAALPIYRIRSTRCWQQSQHNPEYHIQAPDNSLCYQPNIALASSPLISGLPLFSRYQACLLPKFPEIGFQSTVGIPATPPTPPRNERRKEVQASPPTPKELRNTPRAPYSKSGTSDYRYVARPEIVGTQLREPGTGERGSVGAQLICRARFGRAAGSQLGPNLARRQRNKPGKTIPREKHRSSFFSLFAVGSIAQQAECNSWPGYIHGRNNMQHMGERKKMRASEPGRGERIRCPVPVPMRPRVWDTRGSYAELPRRAC
jgi:hypothetical protein